MKRGFKQTDVGVIPEDWAISNVGREFEIQLGKMLDEKKNVGVMKPYLGNRAIHWQAIDIDDLPMVPMSESDIKKFRLRYGDLLVCEGGEIGKSAIWEAPLKECYYQKALHRLRPLHNYNSRLFLLFMQYWTNQNLLLNYVSQTSIAHLPKERFSVVPLPVPSPREQNAIAELLGDVDALIRGLDKFIDKKSKIKHAAMQLLLTGMKRLPGFNGEWEVKRIGDFAFPSSEKNKTGETLPVLTCSKHLGFVNSLGFFKNQVFSKDLSTYKVIRRGQIGYPSNHVEEGSIGLQNLYDVAVVSPIYVVFSVCENVNSFFLHRMLKLDSYQQKFKKATMSSVDRRGSLRWPAFSQITVSLPTIAEQTAIATVLSDMEAEIITLEQRRDKTRALKQGMMQELLTGRIRLV